MTRSLILPLGLATYAAIAWWAARWLAARGLVLSRRTGRPVGLGDLGIAAAANASIAGAVILEHELLGGGTLASLGLDAVEPDLVACLVVAGVGLGLAASFAWWWSGRARPSPAVHGARLAVALFVLAVGAWMEEVVFRGFAFAWLAHHGAGVALVASSVAFTLVHVPTSRTDRWALLNWALGGLALGGIFLATHSVWIATASHLARNAGNVLWVEPAVRRAPAPWARSAYYAVLGASTFVVACALR